LSFGKYKGRSVIEVLVSDPQYIVWLFENVNNVTFKEETITRAHKKITEKMNDYFRRRNNSKYDDEPLTSNILGL
jgi:hypothetical protein